MATLSTTSRAPLSRLRIARAALAIVDRDGLDALSMRRLGSELGVEAMAIYRRAADVYATEQGDLESALRCYSRSLDAGTDEDLAISPDDHWLLMAIKDARQKEKNDARTSQ